MKKRTNDRDRPPLKRKSARVPAHGRERGRAVPASAGKPGRDDSEWSRDAFLANTVHDLRQPLHAIGLFLGAIETELARAKTLQEARDLVGSLLGRLNQSMQGVDRQVQRLLDWSRLRDGQIEPIRKDFDLAPLLGSLDARFAPLAEVRGLRWKVLRHRHLQVHSDAELLIEVLMNLLSNAFRYTSQGTVLLQARRCQGHVLLQVRDSGSGLRPEQAHDTPLAKGGDARRRLARGNALTPAASMGLGLAIVRLLADKLSLRVSYRSWSGRGTVVSLTVPLAHAEAAPGVAPQAEDFSALRGRMVLVIDDDIDVLTATALAMRGLGMYALVARSIDEARRVLSASERYPDILITDHQVGPARSDEIIAAIRREIPTPVHALVVTGDTDPASLRRLGALDAQPVIKPASAQALARALIKRLD